MNLPSVPQPSAPARPDAATTGEHPPELPFLVRLAARMNEGRAKVIWTAYQRLVGARLVEWGVGPALRVHGLDRLQGTGTGERGMLLVANHRSFFDMFVVSSVLLRRVPGRWRLYFPVRGRYCYRSFSGALLNGAAAGWSMYPPFFREPGTRALDRLMLARLIAILQRGPGHVVGFHPEGTRNTSTDPYSLLPPHPGVGELVLAARPRVVPVFVAGLGNDIMEQVRASRRGGPPVRVHFGHPVPDETYAGIPARARGHAEIARDLMRRVAALGEEDRETYATG